MSDISEISVIDSSISDKEGSSNELSTKNEKLEREKNEMQEQFNRQRAKLQQLYLSKEEENKRLQEEIKRLKLELEETKNELVIAGIVKENEVEEERRKARNEIASLNQLLHDTVEESSSSHTEMKKMHQIIQHLQGQIDKLRMEKEKDSLLLAPSNMLSVTKTIAKKIMGSDSDQRYDAENLEESMKKAKEDADVIRSLVVPLEAKIAELTEELHIAEEKLKNPDKVKLEKDSAVSPVSKFACDMCANYETQLQGQQNQVKTLENEKRILEGSLEKLKEEFTKETQFRKEMEDKWNEKKEQQKSQVAELRKQLKNEEKEMKYLRSELESLTKDVRENISRLKYDREAINAELDAVYKENEKLVGKHHANAEQLRNESINFPDSVAELQELLLRRHEELIAAKVAAEAAIEREETLRCEIQLLRDQNEVELNEKRKIENLVVTENNHLKKTLDEKEGELKETIEELNVIREKDQKMAEELEALKTENNKKTVEQQKRSIISLQEQLDNSEKVQKDFVRLSQELQVKLEKIRDGESEVRWQHDDDIYQCPECHSEFKAKVKKEHCKHCGHIFCGQCLRFVVNSGPNQRPANVCKVCHTLLNRNSAPYFSQEIPSPPIR